MEILCNELYPFLPASTYPPAEPLQTHTSLGHPDTPPLETYAYDLCLGWEPNSFGPEPILGTLHSILPLYYPLNPLPHTSSYPPDTLPLDPPHTSSLGLWYNP